MIKFQKQIQAQFLKMCATGKLFRSALTGRQIWQSYLLSFDETTNPIFRDPESSSKNCNHCNNFIRRYGNIVAIDSNNNIMTLFDVPAEGDYEQTAKSLSFMLRQQPIKDVFFETFNELNSLPYESCKKNQAIFRLGTDKNPKRYNKIEAAKFGVVKEGETRMFNHIFLDISSEFVDITGATVETIMNKHRSNYDVFSRAMCEISLHTLILVKDLTIQGSLLDAQTHLFKVEAFIKLKKEYDALPESVQDNWCWNTSRNLPLAKFRNELIGVLCKELTEGMEINKACLNWNKRVDPANYMKAVAPFTQTQKDNAQKFVTDNGYTRSFTRRLANIDDIKASEIKHINSGDGKIEEVSMFDNIKSKSTQHKRSELDKVEEVSIETFMDEILPTATSLELFLENKHTGNMVTMTTSTLKTSKPMFKWDNNYSWTYNGNLAGKSQIKEAVKAEGGAVDGVLNFRLAWNKEGGIDNSDLDAWALDPSGEIGFSTDFRKNRTPGRSPCSGQLDVDNQSPNKKLAVENITWNNISKMREGIYKLWVNQWSARNSQGFIAEVEFNGETYTYTYNRKVTGNVQVAEVTLKNGQFTIKHKLPVSSLSNEIYGLYSEQFHKVNLVCLSPNHWGDNKTGNKHYFFMLNKCKAESDIRGYHIENFNAELAEHRKVLEPLATTIMIPPTGKQLSGLGFNATVKDEVVVKIAGSFKRMVRIKF